jgi:Frizzled/Smoothened family membrane region
MESQHNSSFKFFNPKKESKAGFGIFLKMSAKIILLALVLSLTLIAKAQICIPFEGVSDTCYQVFDADYEVFTVALQNVTQQLIAPQVAGLLDTFLPPSPKVCADLMVKFLCQYMGKCVRSTASPPAVALWSRPCQSLCSQFVQTCAAVFDNAGLGDVLRSQLANCSAVDAQLGLPMYPDVGTLYELGGGAVEFVPCERFENATMDGYEPPCNEPLVFVESRWLDGAEPGCAPPCPAMTYTDGEWDNAIVMINVVAIAGFVTTLLAGITQLFFAKHRRYPGSAALFVTLCVNQISFAFMISSRRSVWCHNDYTNAGPDTGDSFCLWQGFWLIFWALAGVFWWATVAWNMFYIIVLHKKPTQLHHIIAHVVCWAIPMILAVVTISFDHVAYVDTAFWCFIDRGDDGWWQCMFAKKKRIRRIATLLLMFSLSLSLSLC